MVETNRSPVKVIETYLEHLQNGDFEKASEQFTEDAIYIHPPTFSESAKMVGKDNILKYFKQTRGDRDVSHTLTDTVEEGDIGVIIGTSTGSDIEEEHHYIAYGKLQGGKLAYYSVSYRPAD